MKFDPELLARDMPLLTRMNGVFVGEYLHVDEKGEETDRHAVHMRTWVDSDGRHQQNTYTWDDGRQEVHCFHNLYDGNAELIFDNERIRGRCWEIDTTTVMLTWRRKDLPTTHFCEIGQLSGDGQERTRLWHRFSDDRLAGRVLIRETRRPDDFPPPQV